MQTMTLVLFLVVAVLLSAVVDRFIKNITLPLVQIVLGIVIAIFASNRVEITLDSDLFMVLFIAPLLYIEAKHASKLELWKDVKPVLGLAIGLVVVTSIVIGVALHAFIPAISIWAALALGAALGPTDAVAVTSVSKTTNIPNNLFSVLKGELLFNDASGIVMFQMAVVAFSIGTVDLVGVGIDFIEEFVGGLIVGLVIGFAGKVFLKRMWEAGLDSTVFHVLFEICLPFVVYLLSDAVGVSGIIAVVAAGLIDPIQNLSASPASSRMNIVSESFWDVFSFVLNGIVFVLLGTQIPTAMFYVWSDASISNGFLLLCILFVTAILMVVRFLWCLIMVNYLPKGVDKEKLPSKFKQALILTLCGAKGTITLSILFTLPLTLAAGDASWIRDLIIFIGCGVIVLTLLLATFVLPLIAPKKEMTESEETQREAYYENLQIILREVIYKLTASENDLNRRATAQVIKDYQVRLDAAKQMVDDDDESVVALRLRLIDWEESRILELVAAGETKGDVADALVERLETRRRLLSHINKITKPEKAGVLLRARFRTLKRFFRNFAKSKGSEFSQEVKDLRVRIEKEALDYLKDEMEKESVPTENASKIILEYEHNISYALNGSPSVTTAIRAVDATEDVRAFAYMVERDKIDELCESGKLSRKSASKMRDNVALMELELSNAI